MKEVHQNTDLIFTGIMDKDSADEFIQDGNYRDAWYIRNGHGSEQGSVFLMKGDYAFPMTLPDGFNICIGGYEDKRRQSYIFFLWNANNNDSIWRWFPNEDDPANPSNYGRLEKIVEDDLGFERHWTITNVSLVDDRLLSWTDARGDKFGIEGNPPRQLDIEKMSYYNKYKQYEIYAGIPNQGQFVDGTEFYITVLNDDGPPHIWNTTLFYTMTGFYNDPYGGLEELANQINTYATANSLPLTAVYENHRVIVTMALVDTAMNITGTSDIKVVGTNFYVSLAQEAIFDLAKWAPRFAPTAEYGIEPSIDYSFVNRKLFQFRVRYYFDSGAKSAWSSISKMPFPIDAAGNHLDGVNHIVVDYSDSDIFQNTLRLSHITAVEIAFREGNAGLWKSAEVIDRADFGISQQIYKFFNNEVYSTVASDDDGDVNNQVLKIFDDIPIRSNALQEISDKEGNSRLALGGNDVNRTPLESVDLRWTVTTEQTNPCLITVTGKIEINDYDTNQYKFDPFAAAYVALDGFVVYLAGTDLYGISDSFTVSPTGVFTINNVPPGKYILRVANYKVRNDNTYGDKHNLTNGIEWQKTSAPVIDCAGSLAATTIPYERELDLTGAAGTTFDLMTEAGYGPIIIQNFKVDGSQGYMGLEAYLLDNDATASTNAERKIGVGMNRQRVELKYIDGFSLMNPATTVNIETDHNGYWWYVYTPVESILDQVIFNIVPVVADICNPPNGTVYADRVVYAGSNPLDDTWAALYNDAELVLDATNPQGPFPAVAVLPNAFDSIGVHNTDTTVAAKNKTQVTGSVVDVNGNPVEGAVVVLTRGQAEKVGPTGIYSLVTWAPFNSSAIFGSYRSDDELYICYEADVCYDYPPSPQGQTLNIGQYCVDVDSTTFFEVPDILIPYAGLILLNSRYLKSGGNYKAGVVYKDKEGRRCTVCRAPDLYIPFHTEAGVYERPVVNWEIHSFPPDWADVYNIVLSKDGIYNSYFHWVAEEISYQIINTVDDTPTGTTYAAGNATHVFIKISAEIDPDETGDPVTWFFRQTNYFTFQPQQGDRVRIILDETGTIISPADIYDYEIVGIYVNGSDYYAVIKADGVPFELKNSFLVEFYTPNSLDEQIYYDRGQDYDVLYSGSSPYHAGPTNNQNFSGTPARGRLTCGSEYWRERNFVVDASTAFTYLTENNNFSDIFDSIVEDIGIPNVYDRDFRNRFNFSEIALSDVYIPGSLVSGLSSFRQLQKQVVDRDFGPIRKMPILGSTLLVVCENKSQPVYIGQAYVMDLSGQSQIGLTDRILNIANQTVHDYGTQNPESIDVDNGSIKGWDANKGVVWQYSQNGQVPITKLMVQQFNEWGKECDDLYDGTSSQYFSWCPAVFQRKYGTYIITMVKRDTRGDLAIGGAMYDDQKNGWICQQDIRSDYFGKVGLWNVQFLNGQLYIADEGDPGSFLGSSKEPSITTVLSAAPATVKDFHNIELLANDLWTADEITTQANNMYASGQLSRIKEQRWGRYNGMWSAEFLRDINDPAYDSITPEATRQVTALMYGRILKNNTISVKLVPTGSPLLATTWLKVVRIEWTPAMDTK